MIKIKNWIICILVGAFLINIVDIILPKSKLKPYINLVCRFIFVFIVISPVISFISTTDSLEDMVLKYINSYNEKYLHSSTEILNDPQNISLNREYEENLKDVLKLKLDEYGYELEELDLEGTEIKSIKIKEVQNKDKEDVEAFKEKSLGAKKEEDSLKNDLIKIFKVSIDKIEIE